MILLLGSDAYSPFRLDALRAAIAKLDPSLGHVDIDAKWVYALQTDGDSFDSDELKLAESLLCAEGDCCEAAFYVTPRKGTISPWSSKATDIFRNCGLASVARVERGIRYRVSPALPEAAFAALFDLVRQTNGAAAGMSSDEAGAVLGVFRRMDEVLGVIFFENEKKAEEIPDEIKAMLAERAEARKAKNWAESDRLRDAIAAAGWLVKDSKEGQTCTRK